MDKRTVVAIALIGLIIILLPWYMKQIGGNAPKQLEMEETVSQRETAPGVEAGKLAEATRKGEYPPVETGQVLANIKEVDPREIKVESDLFRGVIDTRGAVLTSWDIKPRLRNPQEQEWVKLLPTIVESGALSLSFPYNGREICTDELVFESKDEPLVLSDSRPEGSLMFSAVTADGLRIMKEFLFHHRKQSFGLRVKIEGAGIFDDGRQYTLWWNPGLRPTEKRQKDDLSSFAAYAMLGDELIKTSFGRKQVIVDSTFSGNTKWMATQTKYFLMAMLPPQDVDGLGMKINWVFQKENKETDSPEQRAIGGGIHMPLQRGMCDHSWEIYLGPMDYFTLQEYGRGLERTV
ncbi:membrane protein insertase YidC, partial [bacterium]|nr:membrane protein insertase YidC [bacterium]